MGYIHIYNLYKDQSILLFKECYALEKIHGTSTSIHYDTKTKTISFFSGGEKSYRFESLFNIEFLQKQFDALNSEYTIYGEAYGGEQQKMSDTYGPQLKFVAFDVAQGKVWKNVHDAADFCQNYLKLEFVDYVKIPATIDALDAERDRESIQAIRNGMGRNQKREGIVIRPLFECLLHFNKRVIVKHKNKDFQETKTEKKPQDEIQVLTDAKAIAEEWVTANRLEHVLQKWTESPTLKDMKRVISAMISDIYREGEGEIVQGKPVENAIAKATVDLLRKRLTPQND